MHDVWPGGGWSEDAKRIDPAKLEGDVAIGELSREVSRGDPAERCSAVDALVWLGDRRAVSPLIRGLGDPEWAVRLSAADGLSRFSPLPEWVLGPLREALSDPEPGVRSAVARSLASLPSAEAARALAPVLGDRFRCVRLAAAWALEELGSQGFPDAEASGELGRLLEREDDAWVAYAAYWALGWHPDAPGSGERRSAFRWSEWGATVWALVTGQ